MNMKKLFLIFSILVASAMLLAACAPAVAPTTAATVAPTVPAPICTKLGDAPTTLPAAGQLGASDNPITMAFVPSGEAGIIATASQAIADCLNQMTGLFFKVETGTSFAAAVEAMGAEHAQVGFLNTFNILVAQSKYNILPALVNLRNYVTVSYINDPDASLVGKLEPFYKGEFYASVSSGIKAYADLKGKKFCFVDATSTSGYVIPRIIMKANGIDPDTDITSVESGSHVNSIIGVYNGTCDAGAGYIDILTDAKTNETYPDMQQKVKVFAITDRIPNDGVQYIETFPAEFQSITTEALLAMSNDPGGKAVLVKLYTINAFQKFDEIPTIYSDFLAVLQKAGVDPASLVK
jgi:phosphonate transport system substrate-binding protein